MKKRKNKRIVAWLLCALMLLSLFQNVSYTPIAEELADGIGKQASEQASELTTETATSEEDTSTKDVLPGDSSTENTSEENSSTEDSSTEDTLTGDTSEEDSSTEDTTEGDTTEAPVVLDENGNEISSEDLEYESQEVAENNPNRPLDAYLDSISLTVDSNGTTKTYDVAIPDTAIDVNASKDSKITFAYNFTFPDKSDNGFSLVGGDKFTLDLDSTYLELLGTDSEIPYVENGVTLAVWHIDKGSGHTYLEVTDALAERERRSGSCFLQYQLKKNEIGTKDQIEIDLTPSVKSDNVKITLYPEENKKTPATISKGVEWNAPESLGYKTNDKTGIAVWNISITPGQNTTTVGMKIKESLPAGMEIVKAVMGDQDITSDFSDGTYTINQELKQQTTILVVTKTDLSGKTAKEPEKFSNAVELQDSEGKPLDESTSDIYMKPEWVTKSGVYDKDTNTITWTIVANPNGMDLSGPITIEDDVTLKDITKATVNGSTVISPSTLFPYKIDAGTKGPVTITYTQKFDEKLTDMVTNKVTVTNPDGPLQDVQASAGPDPVKYTYIKKDTDWNAPYITWTVVVNPSDESKISNPSITDTLPAGFKLCTDQIQVTYGGQTHNRAVTVSGQSFTYNFADEMAYERDKFGADGTSISKEYVITYKTMLDYSTGAITLDQLQRGQIDAINTVELLSGGTKKATTTATRWQYPVKVLEKNYVGFNYQTKEITWTITANTSRGVMKDCVITDTVPAEQTLVKNSFEIKKTSPEGTVKTVSLPAGTTQEDNQFSIPMGDLNNEMVTVTYKTKVREDYLPKAGESKTYKNHSSIKADGLPEFAADATSGAIDGLEDVKKSGVLENNADGSNTEAFLWTVDINKQQKEIQSGTTLTDIIPAGLKLDETAGKIQLIECTLSSNGDLVEGTATTPTYTYDKFSNKFVVTIPTGKKTYRLKFRTTKERALDSVVNTATFSLQNPASSDTFTIENVQNGTAGVLIKGEYGTLEITKVDSLTKKVLSGAVFGIYTKDGNNYTQLGTLDATDVDGKTVWTQAEADKTYYLREITAPDGYKANDEFLAFTVGADETKRITIENNLKDTERTVSIQKRDLDNAEAPLAGAEFALYVEGSADTDPLYTWTSTTAAKVFNIIDKDATPNKDKFELQAGKTYVVKETKPPKGYSQAADVTFTINDDKTVNYGGLSEDFENPMIPVGNKRLSLKIAKEEPLEGAGGSTIYEALPGAKLQLTDKGDNVIATWTSGATAKEIAHNLLTPGETYTLTELQAPEGYKKAESIQFKITEDGKVTYLSGNSDTTYYNSTRVSGSTAKDNTIYMLNKQELVVKFNIKKLDGTSRAYVAGAKVTLTSKGDSSISREYTTGTSGIEFTMKSATDLDKNELAPGTYILSETGVPSGYQKAEDIEFTLYEDGSIQIGSKYVTDIEMIDERLKDIYIDKQDFTSKTGLAGASLKLTEGTTVLDTWISNGKPHKLDYTKFKVGGTYTLTEVSAPDPDKASHEYKITPPITFKITEAGDIQVTDTTGVGIDYVASANRLTMYDARVVKSINISKKAVGASDELPGAKLQIQKPDGTLVLEWTSSTTMQEIKMADTSSQDKMELAPGTYKLVEITAPYGYEIEESITFTVNSLGVVSSVTTASTNGSGYVGSVLVMRDAPKKLSIFKQIENSSGLVGLEGATLALIKKNLDKSETTVETWITDTKSHEFMLGTGAGELQPGDYILREISAPKGYKKAADMKISVDADATITVDGTVTDTGRVVMYDAVAPNILISKMAVSGTAELPGATIGIYDEKNQLVMSWESKDTAHAVTIGESDGELAPGTYRLVETAAPGGYQYAESILFDVNEAGKINLFGNGEVSTDKTTLTMRDKLITDLTINKYKIGTTDLVPGATYELHELVGSTPMRDPVYTFVTTDSATTIPGNVLKARTSYLLVETMAPVGYTIMKPVVIKLDSKGELESVSEEVPDSDAVNDPAVGADSSSLNVKETLLSLKVKKVDRGDSSVVLPGAEFAVRVKGRTAFVTGTEVTTGTNGIVEIPTDKLRIGVTYELVETKAPANPDPDGKPYSLAQPIAFVFNDAGQIVLGGITSTTDTITVYDDKLGISFLKVDENDKAIEGVTLELKKKSNSEVIGEWKTTSVPKSFAKNEFNEAETYILTEKSVVPGYIMSDPIEFKFQDASTTVSITGGTGNGKIIGGSDNKGNQLAMIDETIKVSVDKVADDTGSGVAGAKLEVVEVVEDGTNALIERWTTDGTVHNLNTSKMSVGKTYKLVEVEAPKGYQKAADITFTLDNKGIVMIGDTPVADNKLQMVDTLKLTEVRISKTDATNGEELPGAKLEIQDEEGKVIKEFVSGATPTEIEGEKFTLPKNDGELAHYKLTEVTAPFGYEMAESIDFALDNKGVVYVKGEDGNFVTLASLGQDAVIMEDKVKTFTVSKVDMTNGEELPGAKLTIKDKAGKVIDTWTSTENKHLVPMNLFKANEEYTLTEVTAPDGYEVAETITFIFDDSGKIFAKDSTTGEISDTPVADNELQMVDKLKQITISKTDIAGNELPGATLTLYDGETIVRQWKSTTTPQTFGEELEAGKSYTLVEEAAPQGYSYATDITFRVEKDRSISLYDETKGVWENQNISKVTMVDDVLHVAISKTDIAGKEVPGANLQVVDEQGTVIDSWTSGSTPHTIATNLQEDVVYTLVETAAPTGYQYAESIRFKLDKYSQVLLYNEDTKEFVASGDDTVTMIDEAVKVTFSKKDATNGEELPGAKITITDKSGKEVYTFTSGEKPTVIEGTAIAVPKNDGELAYYKLTEVTAPFGYEMAESIDFALDKKGVVYVKGEDGSFVTLASLGQDVVIMEDAVKTLTVSKVDMTNGEELPGAKLTIKDKDGNVIDTWTSTKDKHPVPMNLFKANEEYTLTEVTAPEGYEVSETITFIFDDSGKLFVKNPKTGGFEAVETGILVMEDAPSTDTNTSLKTGDSTPLSMLFILAVLAFAGIFILRRLRREN